ncbi:ribonuclease H-like domain-containing protein [Tanacetum coccineum]
MENANPSSTLGPFPQEPLDTTHAKFTARINKLLTMRQTIDSLLFKTISEMTNQSSDSDIIYPEERIKELELRIQRRNNFEKELFRNSFPTEKELAYHKELLGEPQPPFSTLEPKIRRGDPWSLKIPCVIGTVYTGHAYIDLQSPINIINQEWEQKLRRTVGTVEQEYEPSMKILFSMIIITNNTNSTNKADDTAHGVSTTHTQCNGVNYTSLDNLCDAVICAFLASQPNSPQLSQEDLEQLHPDDLEEMDLQWEMAMLTIRARRFIKRTGKKLDINGQRVGFDKSKVECFNCHKHGHFARECRFPRNQEYKGRENNTRTIAVETPTQNALIAQDGIGGYDWSYQAEEEQPTNHALMAFTSSGSSSSSDSEVDSCSKTCVKAYASLKEQYDNLSSDYKKSQFNLVSYKAGLESVEARLAHYKKNEVVFEESINVLKLKVRLRDNALNEYKMNLEKAKKERDQLKQTLEKFQNSSKSLNNILESQVIDKFKTGLGYDAATAASPAVESFVNLTDKSGSDKGYHSVPPPLTGNFIPRKPDLTFVDEIVKSENLDVTTVVTPSNAKTVENKGVSNTVESNVVRMNNTSAPIIEDWNSDDESEIDYTVRPNTEKLESVKTVREADAPKKIKQYPRGNQRNWNNLISQRLGSDFKMTKKACYVCGSFEHLHYVCDKKVERTV